MYRYSTVHPEKPYVKMCYAWHQQFKEWSSWESTATWYTYTKEPSPNGVNVQFIAHDQYRVALINNPMLQISDEQPQQGGNVENNDRVKNDVVWGSRWRGNMCSNSAKIEIESQSEASLFKNDSQVVKSWGETSNGASCLTRCFWTYPRQILIRPWPR